MRNPAIVLALVLGCTAQVVSAQVVRPVVTLDAVCAFVEGPPDQTPVCCQGLVPDFTCGVTHSASSCEEAGGLALPACLCCGLDLLESECTGNPTECGVGECRRMGTWECQDGVLTDTCVPGMAGTETCDGLDNDCDGLADEGAPEDLCPDDPNACIVAVACDGGRCVLAPRDCDDSMICTDDFCDPASGCRHEVSCDDQNPCTEGLCGSAGQCVFEPTPGRACDDGNACTVSETCDVTGGCSGRPVICDDGDPCTNDTCDPSTGCRHEPIPGCAF